MSLIFFFLIFALDKKKKFCYILCMDYVAEYGSHGWFKIPSEDSEMVEVKALAIAAALDVFVELVRKFLGLKKVKRTRRTKAQILSEQEVKSNDEA